MSQLCVTGYAPHRRSGWHMVSTWLRKELVTVCSSSLRCQKLVKLCTSFRAVRCQPNAPLSCMPQPPTTIESQSLFCRRILDQANICVQSRIVVSSLSRLWISSLRSSVESLKAVGRTTQRNCAASLRVASLVTIRLVHTLAIEASRAATPPLVVCFNTGICRASAGRRRQSGEALPGDLETNVRRRSLRSLLPYLLFPHAHSAVTSNVCSHTCLDFRAQTPGLRNSAKAREPSSWQRLAFRYTTRAVGRS